MTNSITPPPELVGQWQDLIARAAQWGADQELEACKQYMHDQDWFMSPTLRMTELHNARRPKPPSAVAQAETLIERHEDGWVPSPAQWHTIREGLAEGRRALEALPND
jgi:hypothetical protein